MEFDIILKRNDYVMYFFNNGDFDAYDANEYDPISISGDIIVDGEKVGYLNGYELPNDKSFYSCCDGIFGDLETIQQRYVINQV